MKLPRWTVYPALALLAAMLVLAFPHPQEDVHRGAARASRRAAVEADARATAPEPADESVNGAAAAPAEDPAVGDADAAPAPRTR